MNEFKILLQAVLDSNSIGQSDITKIQKVIDKYHINLTTELNTASMLAEIKKVVPQLEAELSKIYNTDIKINDTAILKAINQIGTEAERTANKVGKITQSLNNGSYSTQIDQLKSQFQKFGLSADEAENKVKELRATLSTMESSSGEKLVATYQNWQNQIKSVKVQLDQTKLSYDKFAQPVSDEKITSLLLKIQNFLSKNTAITKEAKTQLELYMKELSNGNVALSRWNQINQSLTQTESHMRTLGKLGLAFKDQWTQAVGSFKVWLSATTVVMGLINKVRQIPQVVTELDTAIVDLKKTTTMASDELQNFYYIASDTGKQVAATTKEIIEQASAWSRLGYSSNDAATKMAKYSAMFRTISPGMDLNSATDGLVSVMKAFKIGEDNVDDIVDGIMSKINIIGNTQALDNSDIVDFLTRSSSAMAEANNTLEETIALGTAATEITRDAASVGNMLKTVSMRIRGYDEDTESYTNDVEELSGVIADLTKTASTPGGISLFTDDSKETFKSTYELLKEISGIWSQLNDKTQAKLLEALAGKRQGQAVSAIISNFGAAEKSMDSMANSAGNAQAEMDVAMDSIEAKSIALQDTLTSIAQNLLTQDDAKNVITFFTKIAEMTEKATDGLGLFKTAALGIATALSFKNVGECNYIS